MKSLAPNSRVSVAFEGRVVPEGGFTPDGSSSVVLPLAHATSIHPAGGPRDLSRVVRALLVVCTVLVCLVCLVGALALAALRQSQVNGSHGTSRATVDCDNWTALHPGQPLIKECR